MRTPRIAPAWSMLPLALWLLATVLACVLLARAGAFTHPVSARDLYDSGTRAALAGDHARAVLDLRRAQRLSPGLLPIGEALGARIDHNLAEVRRRIAQPGSQVPTSASPSPTERGTGSDRPFSDRLLAFVRAASFPLRLAAAASLCGLALSLLAVRALRVAAGLPAHPRQSIVIAAFLTAFAAGVFAVADQYADSRTVEAVLVAEATPRSGPDDLLYPPASTAAWPAGTEVVIRGVDTDGRWLRVAPANAPLNTAAAYWLPRAALEPVIGRVQVAQ